VADTVGGDKAAILDAWEREARGESTGLHPQDFFPDDDKVHKNEPLIRWVAEKISGEAREVRKGRKTPTELRDFYVRLEAALPQIAYWVEKTQPDLFRMSALQAIGLASDMEVEDDFPVPQGEVIYRFPDGWTVQELKTPEQVYAEGEVMQHCMRESAHGPEFCEQIDFGETRLFSLRNPQGRPGVSMEYDAKGKQFVQIFAKQNVSLGSSLQKLRDEEVANEDGTRRKRHKDPEGLWRGIQKYKKYVAKFINEKFGSEPSGLIMAGAPLPPEITSLAGDVHYLAGYEYPLPSGLKNVEGDLNLRGYNHPLPAGLKNVEGSLLLGGYRHPLPAGLKSVEGFLSLGDYNHPLPEGLTSVGEVLWLHEPGYDDDDESLQVYPYPLPKGLKSVGGGIDLRHYNHPLPAGLTSVGGLIVFGYNHPLPSGLTSVGGNLSLTGYNYPLPAGIKGVEGELDLRNYNHPLPSGLTSVGGDLDLRNYNHPLPDGFTSLGGGLDLRDYKHPLPDGLTRVLGGLLLSEYEFPLPKRLRTIGYAINGLSEYDYPLPAGLTYTGSLDLRDYNHPLPESLVEVRGILILENYSYPLPAGLRTVANNLALGNYAYPLPAGLRIEGNIVSAKNYPYEIPGHRPALRPNRRRTSRRKTSRRSRKTSRS
jgi:hypothetical protein